MIEAKREDASHQIGHLCVGGDHKNLCSGAAENGDDVWVAGAVPLSRSVRLLVGDLPIRDPAAELRLHVAATLDGLRALRGYRVAGMSEGQPLRGFATISLRAEDLRAAKPWYTEFEPVTERGPGFVTASAVDPFGSILGVMDNWHYREVLAWREP